ncbi:MAG: lasso peptide biosynthesis B2 protein [Paraclostridium sp.]
MQNLYVWVRKVKTFIFTIGIKEKFLLIEAFFLTGTMRFKILKIPFNKLKQQLGTYNKESSKEVPIEYYREAKKIRWVVTHISSHTPWESLCLVQSMTVQKMLEKRGVPTTLYLGVNKDTNNEMKAHSWIRCGQMYITGGDGSGYATVAKFSNE